MLKGSISKEAIVQQIEQVLHQPVKQNFVHLSNEEFVDQIETVFEFHQKRSLRKEYGFSEVMGFLAISIAWSPSALRCFAPSIAQLATPSLGVSFLAGLIFAIIFSINNSRQRKQFVQLQKVQMQLELFFPRGNSPRQKAIQRKMIKILQVNQNGNFLTAEEKTDLEAAIQSSRLDDKEIFLKKIKEIVEQLGSRITLKEIIFSVPAVVSNTFFFFFSVFSRLSGIYLQDFNSLIFFTIIGIATRIFSEMIRSDQFHEILWTELEIERLLHCMDDKVLSHLSDIKIFSQTAVPQSLQLIQKPPAARRKQWRSQGPMKNRNGSCNEIMANRFRVLSCGIYNLAGALTGLGWQAGMGVWQCLSRCTAAARRLVETAENKISTAVQADAENSETPKKHRRKKHVKKLKPDENLETDVRMDEENLEILPAVLDPSKSSLPSPREEGSKSPEEQKLEMLTPQPSSEIYEKPNSPSAEEKNNIISDLKKEIESLQKNLKDAEQKGNDAGKKIKWLKTFGDIQREAASTAKRTSSRNFRKAADLQAKDVEQQATINRLGEEVVALRQQLESLMTTPHQIQPPYPTVFWEQQSAMAFVGNGAVHSFEL